MPTKEQAKAAAKSPWVGVLLALLGVIHARLDLEKQKEVNKNLQEKAHVLAKHSDTMGATIDDNDKALAAENQRLRDALTTLAVYTAANTQKLQKAGAVVGDPLDVVICGLPDTPSCTISPALTPPSAAPPAAHPVTGHSVSGHRVPVPPTAVPVVPPQPTAVPVTPQDNAPAPRALEQLLQGDKEPKLLLRRAPQTLIRKIRPDGDRDGVAEPDRDKDGVDF